MAYYMGDYYRGDYYRGDPGLLGSIGKGILKIGGGLLTGGPAGAVAGALGFLGPKVPKPQAPVGRSPIGTITIGSRIIEPMSILPGGRPFTRTAGAGGCPSGFHLNKGRGRRGEPPGSYCVRNRSMNPTNPRALRRAVRRQQSFVAVVRRVLRGTGMTVKRSGMGGTKRKRR